MTSEAQSWLETLSGANTAFRGQIQLDQLPVQREPCPNAIITCMDPRVNPAALGIAPFRDTGAGDSQVRVIRTIGAVPEMRSLLIGIHMAGFKEIAIVMHTDCGCCLAYDRIDAIIENMQKTLRADQWQDMQNRLGEPFRENLMAELRAFQDPREAVRAEVARLRQEPFVPGDLVVHGLVYELATAQLEVVVDGYQGSN